MVNNPKSGRYITSAGPQGDSVFQLRGAWTIHNAAAIQKDIIALTKAQKHHKQGSQVDLSGIEDIDTAGAWLLKKYFGPDAQWDNASEAQIALLKFLPDELTSKPEPDGPRGVRAFFVMLGRYFIGLLQLCYELMVFTGQIATRFMANFASPRHFRFPSIVRHIYEAGIQAIPIVALLGLLMSMVISYQASVQLQKFGAALFTIDLGVISVLREMGVLITAIMVAGRSGSAFAAEIGVMKLREEVDALKTMGIDPVEVLVLPRVIALVIALPLLTVIADIIGLAGGSVMTYVLMDIPFDQYFDRAEKVATFNMFLVGMIKAPVFAYLIALIGTYQGMKVSGSAESVGRLTTVAVVQSIFLVIMADAFFSIIFSKMGL